MLVDFKGARIPKSEAEFLQDKILYTKRLITAQLSLLKLSLEIANYYASLYLPSIPADYIAEMQGMADAIDGVSFEDILFQNVFWDVYYGLIIPQQTGSPQPPLGACSVVSSYQKNGKVITAQNVDLTLMMS